MKKFIVALFLFVSVVGCSSGPSDKEIYDELRNIRNWYVEDLWNDGLVNISHYNQRGKDALGREMDIEMTLKQYNDAMAELEEHNDFIESLEDEKYDDVKYAWGKLYDNLKETDKVIQDNKIEPKGKLDLKTNTIQQYSNAFDEYVYKLDEE